ncbi:MAG TPA: succinate dehydrogenase/fumarate reductase flavoprotein subunit, partial [Thermomicrobiales bacterium]|nr:succinate dehydrogenase/fumarate reductase flavoprotein subunit [Thermomicrobiales bacterium]
TQARSEIDAILSRDKGERAADIRKAMQDIMMDNVSVVRNEQMLTEAQAKIAELQEAYRHVAIQDKGKRYNTELTEALELGCMLDCAETIVHGALQRTESRGAHYRDDYEARDDTNWLAHSMITRTPDGLQLEKKPIVITIFEPKERKY